MARNRLTARVRPAAQRHPLAYSVHPSWRLGTDDAVLTQRAIDAHEFWARLGL